MSELADLYQEVILDHYKRPRNAGPLAGADRQAAGHNPLCGDRVTVFVRLGNGVIAEVRFAGAGCAIATASASLMTESVKGRTPAEAMQLFRRFRSLVTGAGDGAPGGGLGKLEVFSGVAQYPLRVKCATLAWHTLVAALENRDEVVSTE